MDNSKTHDLVIAIGSRNFFGAERRFFKISKYINSQDYANIHLYLLINSSLYLSALKIEWAKDLLHKFELQNKLIVIPDNIKGISLAKGLLNIFKIVFSKKFRAILHGRVISIPRLIFKKDTIFEVTSIDEAKHIIDKYPKFLLNNVRCFNCVSETVANDFSNFARGAGYEFLIDKIKYDKFPFFESKDIEDTEIIGKEKNIVFASRFIDRKNPVLFAKACKLLLENCMDWNVYICGKGPLEDVIKDILSDYIKSGRVKVLYSMGIEEILKKSILYVSLIEPDNYPSQSILEAMYYGNCLLLSNTGTSSRFISEKRQNGLLCDLDAMDVYHQLSYLCDDIENTKIKGKQSKLFLEESFSSEMYIKNFMEITNKEI